MRRRPLFKQRQRLPIQSAPPHHPGGRYDPCATPGGRGVNTIPNDNIPGHHRHLRRKGFLPPFVNLRQLEKKSHCKSAKFTAQ